MTGPAMEYARHHGGVIPGAKRMADDLMRGDPEEHKSGYSAANAWLMVREAFDHEDLPLNEQGEEELAEHLSIDGDELQRLREMPAQG